MKVSAPAGRLRAAGLVFVLACLYVPCAGVGAASERPARSDTSLTTTAEELLIPFPAAGVPMHARLYRPPGKGPFTLAVIVAPPSRTLIAGH